MTPRVLFIAGSTGAVGRTVVRLAQAEGLPMVPHVRPKPGRAEPVHPHAAVLELSDKAALERALRGCTTVLQLIGTTRARFASGDTYATSDVGTTARLVDAARAVGVDHFVLLSSVGAGRPVGAYLKAKAEAEGLVVNSGLPYTIVRPSAFYGEGHKVPPGARLLGKLPGMAKLRPIAVETLARLLVRIGQKKEPLGVVLEGPSLWKQIDQSLTGVAFKAALLSLT